MKSISQFHSIQTLSCQNDLNQQFLFCREQEGLTELSLCLFSRKRLCHSLGLSHFFLSSDDKPTLPQVDLFLDTNNPVLKNIKGFFSKNFKSGYLIALFHEEKEIGFLFLPCKSVPNDNTLIILTFLKQQLLTQLMIKALELKVEKKNKDLSYKMLEIESLIDVTEIVNEEHQQKKDLYDHLLIAILSILNASKGMVLLKDEKSALFNVISQFNIPKEELPKRILRASKGVLKSMSDEMKSFIIDDLFDDPLLKTVQKNVMLSPIISNNQLEGVLLLYDKESRNGLIKFALSDLRLFDSLSKKVSLAYHNIRLIDSLKNSNKLVDNIMSSISTGIIMINVMGEIEFINQSAKTIFNIAEEEVIDNHYFMVFQNNPGLIELLEKSEAKNEIIYEDNFAIEDLDGTSHEINLTLSPAYDEENDRSGIVFSFEDLSNLNKLKSTFKKYVSENIVDELLQNENSLELGGTQSEVCVLFCDIRGFTALSEKMKPTEVVYLLNHYFEAMIDVVFAYNGTLDKIIGDELMVLYGVPLKSENDAIRAVESAKQMFIALASFNDRIKAEGLPSLEIGIGINYGKVVSGNIGSEKQMNYTVIGDAVNLAARLCSHAKPGEIVISKSVFEQLEKRDGFVVHEPIEVKGKSNLIDNWIYTV